MYDQNYLSVSLFQKLTVQNDPIVNNFHIYQQYKNILIEPVPGFENLRRLISIDFFA